MFYSTPLANKNSSDKAMTPNVVVRHLETATSNHKIYKRPMYSSFVSLMISWTNIILIITLQHTKEITDILRETL